MSSPLPVVSCLNYHDSCACSALGRASMVQVCKDLASEKEKVRELRRKLEAVEENNSKILHNLKAELRTQKHLTAIHKSGEWRTSRSFEFSAFLSEKPNLSKLR